MCYTFIENKRRLFSSSNVFLPVIPSILRDLGDKDGYGKNEENVIFHLEIYNDGEVGRFVSFYPINSLTFQLIDLWSFLQLFV